MEMQKVAAKSFGLGGVLLGIIVPWMVIIAFTSSLASLCTFIFAAACMLFLGRLLLEKIPAEVYGA